MFAQFNDTTTVTLIRAYYFCHLHAYKHAYKHTYTHTYMCVYIGFNLVCHKLLPQLPRFYPKRLESKASETLYSGVKLRIGDILFLFHPRYLHNDIFRYTIRVKTHYISRLLFYAGCIAQVHSLVVTEPGQTCHFSMIICSLMRLDISLSGFFFTHLWLMKVD